jgi:hypothetical protein
VRRAARTKAGRVVVRAVRPGAAPARAPRPRRYRYVVVVTYGRSGSTLVQGLLNTLPRTVVRGENGFYLLDLFHAMTSARAFRKAHLPHNPRASHSAFYGVHEIRPRSFAAGTRALVTGHLLGSLPPDQVDVLGFKEVRWDRIAPEETEDFFGFLDHVFRNCRYVLNQRDHEQVIGSGFWQERDREEVLAAIRRTEEIQEFLRRTRPDRVLDLRYDELTHEDPVVSDAALSALAEFVHGSCDEDLLAQLRETRATGHGPFPFGISVGRRRLAREEKRALRRAQEQARRQAWS